MEFDRILADIQGSRDLFIGQPFGGQLQHLALPLRQWVDDLFGPLHQGDRMGCKQATCQRR